MGVVYTIVRFSLAANPGNKIVRKNEASLTDAVDPETIAAGFSQGRCGQREFPLDRFQC
jgi:hypothetical protein